MSDFHGYLNAESSYEYVTHNEIKDEFTIKNSGNSPEFWNAIENNSVQWRVTAEAFYNLSSMTAGQEHDAYFEFDYKN